MAKSNYDNWKIQNKIVFSEAGKRKAKQAYLFCLLFLFPLKIKVAERRKAGKKMITKEFEKGRINAKKEIKNENPFRIFKNEKFGKIEVLFKDDQFYFPAIEIAEILGYKNPRDAVKRHCVNEFPYVVKHDVGINTGLAVQTIQKKYINEGNLYRLIAKSKLPEAREFERWIFDIVIPSIRKNG